MYTLPSDGRSRPKTEADSTRHASYIIEREIEVEGQHRECAPSIVTFLLIEPTLHFAFVATLLGPEAYADRDTHFVSLHLRMLTPAVDSGTIAILLLERPKADADAVPVFARRVAQLPNHNLWK